MKGRTRSEIDLKWPRGLTTCNDWTQFDSIGVFRSRPSLQKSGQETQTDLQIKSTNIENARVDHYNVCLLKSDTHTWEMEGGQRRKYQHASFFMF